jgi:cation transport protein ChaC
VLDLLETREKQYDERVQIDLFDGAHENAQPLIRGALTYIATADEANLNWLGPPAGGVSESAKQIANAVGPSGPNFEYLFNLCDALRSIEVDDPHVFELENAVKAILAERGET